jgi:hypothetical protein
LSHRINSIKIYRYRTVYGTAVGTPEIDRNRETPRNIILTTSVVDWHLVDAHLDPDLIFHFDADPDQHTDPDPTPSFTTVGKPDFC